MKKILLILSIAVLFGFNKSEINITAPPPTDYDTVFGSPAWNASVHLPSTYYTSAATDSFECIIMMGGLGETGTNVNLNYRYGPLYWIRQGWNGQVTLGNGIHTPIFIVLQNPNAGTYAVESALKTRVDLILARYKIKRGNRNSLHGTGLSAGGWQFTTFATADPLGGPYVYARYFASIVEVQGVVPDDNKPYPQLFANYATVGGNLLAFEGTNDERNVESRVNQMNLTVPGSAQYIYTSESSGGGCLPGCHCCWNTQYNPATTYNIGGLTQNIYQWMLRQSGDTSLTPVGNPPPTCDAGANQSITSPTSSVTLTATASDPGGSIASYQWAKIMGGSATITSPTSVSTTVTGLTVGTYRFTITVTDNLGAICSDYVEITVNPAGGAVNAIAGSDQTISRLKGFTRLDGSASTGSGLTYSWRLITVPDSYTKGNIISPRQAITDVMILPYLGPNGYDFELTVTDGFTSDKDTVRVNISWGTMPPQMTTLRFATAADVTAINAMGNPGLCRTGDLIVDGATPGGGFNIGGQNTDIYINIPALLTTTPLTAGKRILIKSGKYRRIQLQWGPGQVRGATNNKIIVTNYGGQVEFEALIIDNLKHCIFTGEYVPGVSGHPSYRGHANGAYAFSQGTYGFYNNANWASITGTGFAVRGSTDSTAFKFIEVTGGNFAGFQLLQYSSSDDMDSIIVRDIYIHNTHSEGQYNGSTQSDPTHQFKHLVMENVRSAWVGAECPQQGQLNWGNRIQRNVWVASGVNWKSAFHDQQDFGMQVGIRNGKNHIIGNLYLGAGEQVFSVIGFKKPFIATVQDSIVSNQDTVFIRRNAWLGAKGATTGYIGQAGAGQPYNVKYMVDSNYFGRNNFRADEVFTDNRANNSEQIIRAITTAKIIIRNNKRDWTKNVFLCSGVQCNGLVFDTSSNTTSTIPAPLFENSGYPDGFQYENVDRWVDTLFQTWNDEYLALGGTKKGQPVIYSIGDEVIFLSKHYISKINNNHSRMPQGVTDAYWTLRYWLKPNGDTSYYPPEDFRLRSGDTYRNAGIGLYDTLVTTTQNTYYRDADGDTYGNASVTTQGTSPPAGYVADNTDCNDGNAAISPADPEILNSVDDDCDGLIDEGFNTYYQDADGDTYGNPAVSTQATSQPVGFVSNNLDCNDSNANIKPGATEICNGIDDDCDLAADEGVQTTYYRDLDGDTYGNPAVTQQACSPPSGYVSNSSDCNDNNAAIKPGATELANGVDDNCNGQIDEGINTYYRDLDGDTYGNINSATQNTSPPVGYVVNSSDCNDANANIFPGATEICNSLDDDCDGSIDEGVQTTYYRDEDSDTYGNVNVTIQACSPPPGYVSNSSDCNDANANIKPGATETCNAVDDDCDLAIDEGVLTTYYRDLDGDTYGNLNVTIQACSVPTGYVVNSTDCNDNNAAIKPGATEICDGVDNDCDGSTDEGCSPDNDGDGYTIAQNDCNDSNPDINPGETEICNSVDDDCDGQIDEGVQTTYYRDADGDTFGDPNNTTLACSPPTGYVANNTDCNDNNSNQRPTGTEACNGLDDDCDGTIDEGVKTTYYRDLDGDGFGNLSLPTLSCSAPLGHVANSTDCDDNNSSIYPGATELCNSIDDDCDGSVDEGLTMVKYYYDFDGDTYGDPLSPDSINICTTPPGGYVTNKTDCNDANAAIYPGATEVCDGADNDCDGSTDEGVLTTYYRDQDGDGYGNVSLTIQACSVPSGYAASSTDCNDNSAAINPGATEVFNGIDDDCDGQIDEALTPRVKWYIRFWRWLFG